MSKEDEEIMTEELRKLQLKEKYESDIISAPVTVLEGSIRIIRIDGYLESKQMMMNGHWKNICKFISCKENADSEGFCKSHHEYQRIHNVKGEKLAKGNKYFIWDGKSWRQKCSIYLCNDYAQTRIIGKCNRHMKGADSHSVINDASNLYDQIRRDFEIKKQKDLKLKKELEIQKNRNLFS